MTALVLQITAAGRAAIVNAAHTGTAPVTVVAAGLTETAFTADETTAAIPGEFGQLTTLAGDVVGDDTIHLVIRDETSATYDLRGFGLYLDDGTLFAAYGQADPILEKSASALLLLAVDVVITDIDVDDVTFGDTTWINPPATSETAGVVELATDAESLAGASTALAVTPHGLAAVKAALVGGAPVALDTLGEIAASIANDPAFAATMAATLALKAPLASPTLTGTPQSTNPLPGDYSQRIATTAFVMAALALKAPLLSPALTGTPTAPTAAPGTNTTQIATAAFVAQAIAALVNSSPGALDTLKELADALGDDPNFATTVTNALALKAPLASPALTGNPTAPTQPGGNNSTRLATTAFVAAAVSPLAPLASPGFSGAPTAPAPADGDYSTRLATSAFLADAIQSGTYNYVIMSDGPNVYTGTIPGLTALHNRTVIGARFPQANNAHCRINLNGLGQKPVYERDYVTELRANAIPREALLSYRAQLGAWVLLTPVSNGCYAPDTNPAANTVDLVISDGAFQVYYDGMLVYFKNQTTNTGPVVININGAGQKALKYRGAAMAAGEVGHNHIFGALFDAATDTFNLISPPST